MDVTSQFSFGLERKNGQKRFIHSSDTRQLLTDHGEIRRYAVSFYGNLFQSEYREERAVSESFYDGLPQVEQQSNVKSEAAQSSVELYPALQSMQSGKVPGIDG